MEFFVGQHLTYRSKWGNQSVKVAKIIEEEDGDKTIVLDICYQSGGKWYNVGHRHSRRATELAQEVEAHEKWRRKQ